MFRHFRNQITVNDLTVLLAFFLTQEAGYSLPEGAIGREYVPGIRHNIYRPNGLVGADPEWAEGDEYLSKTEVYRTAWKDFLKQSEPTEPLPRPKFRDAKRMLRNTTVFGKAAMTQNSAALTVLMATLTDNSDDPADDQGKLEDFVWSVTGVREAMIAPLDTEEIEFFNEIMDACSIPFHLS